MASKAIKKDTITGEKSDDGSAGGGGGSNLRTRGPGTSMRLRPRQEASSPGSGLSEAQESRSVFSKIKTKKR